MSTIIIGAGQAGLATGYHLQRLGESFTILDGNARAGDQWRSHWDSLRLYSPAKYDGLPGLPFPGDPWHYPGKDEVADYLASYAAHFELPIRPSTRADRLERIGDQWIVTVGREQLTADNVVVATGTFGRTPYLPDYAVDLDPAIRQLHSSEYQRPGQLKDGPVLVVGGSHSGTDIAYEVSQTHPTVLCGRDPGQVPFTPGRPGEKLVWPVLLFLWRHVITRRSPIAKAAMEDLRHHGGPMIRVRRADLRERGVERVLDRVVGVQDGRPLLADGRALDVANVVWATGFQQVFDWIKGPVIGPDGWPKEFRGVVAEAPGLFFCGLCFQYAFSSMVLPGVGRDAAYVAERIAARSRADRSLAAA
ncbi:flavin-containing monooxygenase [Kribbella shirazensis]|uniref:Putative flavoprotein involved in K+ transport n=1 Tax=Kribbella shirazensis TaxID=1105143 RepID=A0A7X6A4B7_9ACTN|nr:NAD(P)/FAD-dependent oxidoreductase [Kribbella shirazensis]NIK60798.1 putative flavoprotein involved in K+ transport [Kribbella shirazensis]